jgi:hypothetical protein
MSEMFPLQIRFPFPSCTDKLPDHCHKKLLSQIRQDVMYLASCSHSNVFNGHVRIYLFHLKIKHLSNLCFPEKKEVTLINNNFGNFSIAAIKNQNGVFLLSIAQFKKSNLGNNKFQSSSYSFYIVNAVAFLYLFDSVLSPINQLAILKSHIYLTTK